ncbi:MAG: hypothetical protein GY861_22325 [bacterium]|nr:hypothetical protein [bacterium]
MGTCYYGICKDCKEFIALDKFYSWCPWKTEADIEREDIDEYKNDGSFIYRSFRLHYFMNKHNGHRIGVYTERHVDDDGDFENYKEVCPWPEKGRKTYDEIDLTDPKFGRAKIKTSIGDLMIDKRKDGINCFFFVANKRIDTLILPIAADSYNKYRIEKNRRLIDGRVRLLETYVHPDGHKSYWTDNVLEGPKV